MAYYVIQTDNKNDFIITDSEEKAIKIYDKMVDDNPDFECLHFSTWKEEDPEGYDENYSIEDFALDFIYVDKFESWNEVVKCLNDFGPEESEVEDND